MKLVKTFSNRELQRNYQETKIDEIKKVSNKLVSIIGKYKTVILATGEMITLTGKREWKIWSNNNEYVTDF